MSANAEPAAAYAERRRAAEVVRKYATQRAQWLSWARLITALVVVALVAASCERAETIPWPIPAVGVALFVTLVVLHGRAQSAVVAAREMIAACDAGVARVVRDWNGIGPSRVRLDPTEPGRVKARDLGVEGDVSLMRLLDVCMPALGGARVRDWLLSDPPTLSEIEARQKSVSGLRGRPDLLVDMACIGRRPVGSPASITRFVAWCSGKDLPVRRGRAALATALTLAVLAMIAFQLAMPQVPAATRMAVPLIIAQAVIALRARRTLEASLDGLDGLLTQLRGAEASMRRIASEPDVDGVMGDIQRELRSGALPALERLGRIIAWNEMRGSPLPHLLANALVGFDSHLLAALERWRNRNAAAFPAWIARLADAEAIVALATLGYDNPRWSMPALDDGMSELVAAERMTHPLIAPPSAVANDVALRAGGEVVVISGSNMSGKTTYLRAIGLNVLLAHAGGPVAAESMRIRRARLRTSIRVEDDLSRGVSLFLAEVLRLRQVVRDAEGASSPPLLFLFDEILHGTNAADRREATRLVLSRLATARASGFVTTHDPAILEGADQAHRHVHFEERIEMDGTTPAMHFDYRLRSGPATTTNALFVLTSALNDA